MKFACDAMLHRLCLWLRLSGHECRFLNTRDDEVIKAALKQNAVLLTRDEELARKAGDYCAVQLLRSHGYLQQLREVVEKNEIKLKFTERYCTVCGGKLEKIEKKKVKGRVWPFTYKTHNQFFQCGQCEQIFWRGSHWKKIRETLEGVTPWDS